MPSRRDPARRAPGLPAALGALLLLVAVPAAWAQEGAPEIIDLDRALALADVSVLSVRDAALSVAAADALVTTRERAREPDLSLQAGLNGSLGRTFSSQAGINLTEPVAAASTSLSSSMVLYGGGALRANLEAARASERSAEALLAAARLDAAWAVTDGLLTIGEADGTVAVREADVEAAAALEARLGALVDLGARTRGELALQRAQTAQARAALAQAQQAAALARLSLGETLGLDPAGAHVFAPPEAAPPLPDTPLPALVGLALDARPDVAAARADRDAAQLLVGSAQAGLRPRVTLGASASTAWISTDDDGLTAQLLSRGNLSTGVQVAVPIFDRGVTRGDVSQAQVDVLRAGLAVERLERSIAADLAGLLASATASEATLAAAKAGRDAAELALSEATARFELGAATLSEVTDARTAVVGARQAEVLAAYDLSRQAYAIQWSLGRLGAGG